MFDQDADLAGRPVLGIDPGVSRCGYGVVQREGARYVALAYGVLRTPPSDDLPDRLAALAADFEALVAEFRPGALAVERVLFQVNTRTAMSVGQASGLALAIAGREHIPVALYSPNEVKLAVAGDGAAGKSEVQAMVTRLLALADFPDPPDSADALALALCHWWKAPIARQIAGRIAAEESGRPTAESRPGTAARSRLGDAIAAALTKEGSSR